tara:strand:+ start:206 stop:1243 length:1038 start_codon:yes stop_codon:yes gene_type:complete
MSFRGERNWLDILLQDSLNEAEVQFENDEQRLCALKDLIPSLTPTLEKDIRRQTLKTLTEEKKSIKKFYRRLEKKWEPAFKELEVFILYNRLYGERVSISYRNAKPNDVKFETLLRLHARACQMSLEILNLLKGGFADGAMARWRSLYEISVISNFLENQDEEVSQKFLDYNFVENYYELIEYQKNCERLGYKSFTSQEVNNAKDIFDAQIQKYGNEFIRPYGWVGDTLPKRKWNFKGIEDTVDFSYMRSYYKMANNYVHSGAKGFIFQLGIVGESRIMLAGPTNSGFIDPAQNLSLSLLYTSATLTSFESYLEDALFMEIGKNMVDKIASIFSEVQRDIDFQES